MTDEPGWPSAPKVLAAALFEKFGSGSTRLPYPLDLPAVQVRRIGGTDDGVTDRARVDVVVIHNTEDEAETLAEQIRQFLVNTCPIRGAGLLLDGATTEVAPYEAPYPDSSNPTRARFDAVYVVTSRRAF